VVFMQNSHKEKGEILLKEIFEQPNAIQETLMAINLSELESFFREPLKNIILMGMGASFNAAVYGQYLFRQFAKVNASAILSSDYIYYPFPVTKDDLVILISQSGETVETVKAAQLLKSKGVDRVFSITNTAGSTLTKIVNFNIITRAGIEKASSTKTYISALAALNLIAKTAISQLIDYTTVRSKLMLIANDLMLKMNNWKTIIEKIAEMFQYSSTRFILASGYNLATSKIAALLFKEAAKIWVEAYDAAEFRHESLEIVKNKTCALILATGPRKQLLINFGEKIKNLGGLSLVLTTSDIGYHEEMEEDLTVFPLTVLLQLTVHNVALKLGVDPDVFLNMRKVTLEE